jgi:hypothetical protein
LTNPYSNPSDNEVTQARNAVNHALSNLNEAHNRGDQGQAVQAAEEQLAQARQQLAEAELTITNSNNTGETLS